MNFWTRLEQIAEQRSVLRHPFYVRWSEGTLTRAELARYSGQYRHAVVALAAAAEAAARSPEADGDSPALVADTLPPCMSMIRLTIDRPSPVELSPPVGFADSRWKRPNRRSMSSGESPAPSSLTRMTV